jgi:hypothetical protein
MPVTRGDRETALPDAWWRTRFWRTYGPAQRQLQAWPFAPGLLAPLIRGGQSHPDQDPNGVGAGWMARLPAAPFINLLSPLRLKSKTDDWDLSNPRPTALFSYDNI